jgi:hypothetical protein
MVTNLESFRVDGVGYDETETEPQARRTQAQLHAATRGNARLHADKRLPPERRMYANPHSSDSDAHGPKQMTAVSTAC